MSELALAALHDLERRPHVVGIAQARDDQLVVLLDYDDETTRAAVERWATTYSANIAIRVIGKIVS